MSADDLRPLVRRLAAALRERLYKSDFDADDVSLPEIEAMLALADVVTREAGERSA